MCSTRASGYKVYIIKRTICPSTPKRTRAGAVLVQYSGCKPGEVPVAWRLPPRGGGKHDEYDDSRRRLFRLRKKKMRNFITLIPASIQTSELQELLFGLVHTT